MKYSDGTEVLNPNVSITNQNTDEDYTVETSASYSYHHVITSSCNISEGDVLRLNASDGVNSCSYEVTVTSGNMTEGGMFEQNLTLPVSPRSAPNITSWYPEETVIEDIEGVKRTFNISINQTVDVIWRINGTEVFNQSGVNFSEYTNESAVAGYWEVTAHVFNENGSDTHTWLWSVKDITPPASVSDLHNITYEQNFINWTWIDPPDADFSHVIVYIDGKFAGNVTKGVQYYNATSLEPNTEHTISTRTVDIWGNINETWVNHTARTAPDTTPPEIVNYEPKGANVSITANITATFSEEINPSTLNNETIIVENGSKHRVKGNIFYDSEHFKMIFDLSLIHISEPTRPY